MKVVPQHKKKTNPNLIMSSEASKNSRQCLPWNKKYIETRVYFASDVGTLHLIFLPPPPPSCKCYMTMSRDHHITGFVYSQDVHDKLQGSQYYRTCHIHRMYMISRDHNITGLVIVILTECT